MNENIEKDLCDVKETKKEKLEKILCKVKSKCKSFMGITVRKDIDVAIRVYSEDDDETPKMNTAINGTIKVNLFKALAVLGIVTVFFCMVASLCRLFRR